MNNSLSNNNTTLPPAFSGLLPNLQWQYINNIDSNKLTGWTQLEGVWQKLATTHEFPLGYYCCQTTVSGYFIKVTNKNQGLVAIEANKVTRYLNAQGFDSNCLIENKIKQFINQHQTIMVLVYPLLTTRFSDSSASDINQLGIKLAKMHELLRKYPYQEDIKKNADILIQKLVQRWHQLKDNTIELNKLPADAQKIICDAPERLFDIFNAEKQMIHGDINLGNSLFDLQGNVHFIDFEHSLNNWSNPLQDLAFILERYVLITLNENIIAKNFNILFTSYFDNAHNKIALIKLLEQFPELISVMLKALSVKCLLILATYLDKNNSIPLTSEWDKFINLYLQAQSQQKLITDLTTIWLNEYNIG